MALLAGCSARLGDFPFSSGDAAWMGRGLTLRFYSVACVRIGFGDVDVLTDPFFSHLPFRTAAFGHVVSDPEQVAPYLDELADVRAVLVGHNHYDHNLDLPAVAGSLHASAQLLGGPTLGHTFAASDLARPVVDVAPGMATETSPGDWWVHPSGAFRVLAIRSGHPNQVAFIHLYARQLDEDRSTAPRRGAHYQEGLTLAFLIDWLDGEEIVRRVYVQTSSTGFPAGFVAPEVRAQAPVDVAVLPMDCANLARRGEATVIEHLDAPVVLFCHYEDFFRTKDQEPREGVKVDLPATLAYFEGRSDRRYLFPAFDTTYRV